MYGGTLLSSRLAALPGNHKRIANIEVQALERQ